MGEYGLTVNIAKGIFLFIISCDPPINDIALECRYSYSLAPKLTQMIRVAKTKQNKTKQTNKQTKQSIAHLQGVMV